MQEAYPARQIATHVKLFSTAGTYAKSFYTGN
jgi:hypothetical protein